MLRLELLPAEFGDAIWIEYGDTARPHRLLVDCGTSAVFPRIRERILALREDDRHFELLVITHIDIDHIGGVLELLRQRASLGVSFGEIWFNGYVHLSAGGVVPQPEAPDILGPLQGEELTELIVASGASRWNAAVHGAALVVPASGPLQPLRELPGGMRLTLLSPLQSQLDRLKPVWDAACRKAGIVPGAATAVDLKQLDEALEANEEDDLLGDPDIELLAATPFKPDGSRPNGTSLAILAEFDGRRLLLAGDAYAPVLIDAFARLPGNAAGGRIRLDAFKLSHHGSRGNTSTDLLRAVDCTNWLVSTNGKMFQHPDGEAIARVIRAGGAGVNLRFNYRSEFNEIWAAPGLQRRHGYSTHYPAEEDEGVRLELAK